MEKIFYGISLDPSKTIDGIAITYGLMSEEEFKDMEKDTRSITYKITIKYEKIK